MAMQVTSVFMYARRGTAPGAVRAPEHSRHDRLKRSGVRRYKSSRTTRWDRDLETHAAHLPDQPVEALVGGFEPAVGGLEPAVGCLGKAPEVLPERADLHQHLGKLLARRKGFGEDADHLVAELGLFAQETGQGAPDEIEESPLGEVGRDGIGHGASVPCARVGLLETASPPRRRLGRTPCCDLRGVKAASGDPDVGA
jgi:hypothetical protein